MPKKLILRPAPGKKISLRLPNFATVTNHVRSQVQVRSPNCQMPSPKSLRTEKTTSQQPSTCPMVFLHTPPPSRMANKTAIIESWLEVLNRNFKTKLRRLFKVLSPTLATKNLQLAGQKLCQKMVINKKSLLALLSMVASTSRSSPSLNSKPTSTNQSSMLSACRVSLVTTPSLTLTSPWPLLPKKRIPGTMSSISATLSSKI